MTKIDIPLIVVDEVTKAGRVNDGQTQANTVLLNVYVKVSADTRLCGLEHQLLTSTDTLNGDC